MHTISIENFDKDNIILHLDDFNDLCINYLNKQENIKKEDCLKEFNRISNQKKDKYNLEYDKKKVSK